MDADWAIYIHNHETRVIYCDCELTPIVMHDWLDISIHATRMQLRI